MDPLEADENDMKITLAYFGVDLLRSGCYTSHQYCRAPNFSWLLRRTHLSNRHTYQIDSLIRLDLKLAKIPPEDTLKFRHSGTILGGFLGALLGPVLIALGPAL